ncbi:TPA: hypothetical protein IAC10_05250 [Candidatus Scatousia excrementigallinarum]|uniref:Uncharacterized protein n=1 Tax=Candidatus Scatousia excrementigallinarum TaxID=2840935 RepID=A0A9D1JML3_9BACT|nr:hypothetical protein [Candidatus Scatousia excrementigallinarum]
MGFQNFLRNVCSKLGENNKPTYAVVAIAAVKGICRPTFTMMDKTEKPETKKYTALREGLTELIAIPVYLACGYLAGKCSPLFTKNVTKEDFLNNKVKQDIANGINNDKITSAVKSAEKQLEKYKMRATNNLRFIGVCAAALVAIPALCSVTIKPVMSKILKIPSETPKPEQKTTSADIRPVYNNKPAVKLKSYIAAPQTGMKVGGV